MLNVSGDSYRTEIYRAYWSTVVCKIGVFILWHYRTVCKKKKIKVALLKICLLVHNMGLVSLSETYLESSVPTDDDIFRIRGYSSVMTIRQAKREVQF